MEKKTVDAIQAAFKQAMDVFNIALQKALAADASGAKAVAVVSAAPKRRGRPAKAVVAKPMVVGGAPKRRGRPPKDGAAKVKVAVVSGAPKRRGRPPKIKAGDTK